MGDNHGPKMTKTSKNNPKEKLMGYVDEAIVSRNPATRILFIRVDDGKGTKFTIELTYDYAIRMYQSLCKDLMVDGKYSRTLLRLVRDENIQGSGED